VEPGVSIESFSPQPAEPGDTVNLHVTVHNEGDTTTTFAPVDVETVDGVSVIGTTDAIGSQFTLCGGCQRTGTVKLKVDEDAVSGTYPVDVTLATPAGDGVVETAELEVDGEPNLLVQSPTVNIVPGDNTTATLTVTNIGTDTASQATVSLSDDMFALQPSPVSLGRIAPGETVRTPVTLAADSDISNGIDHLDLPLTYRDESDTVSTTATLTADILEQASVVISDVHTDGATVGKEGTVTLTLENLGPGEAERIVAELGCGETATVSSGKAFIGQLDDEENVPVTFTVTPREEQAQCEVTVRYHDAAQRQVTEAITFSADEQGTSPVLIVIAVVAVLGAVLYWRRTRKQDELAEI
ncbi:MAG: hypothetical protein SVY41_01885, partial [Candidatus Nanohaloarchaea archaeon]|nr:hypothetical protein [Candidatus Nanohaloarchaea archaeon]